MVQPYTTGKHFSVTPPAAIIDNAAVTTAEIDTLGFDHLTVVMYLGATDIALTVAKLQSGDVSGTHADVSGLDFDGDTDIDGNTATLPSATDDNKFFIWDVDLRGQKRYWDVAATVGDGTSGGFVAIWAVLSRGDETPTTMAERGADQVLRIPA